MAFTAALLTRRVRPAAYALLIALTLATLAPAQPARKLTTPKEALGFEPGDDYMLANYTQLGAWWKKLAAESDRMKLVEIGKTEEGRPQWMSIITSPENHKKLAHFKEIARKLALAEGLSDDEARALAHEGKAVVWIDGGLHASEVLGAAQLTEFVQHYHFNIVCMFGQRHNGVVYRRDPHVMSLPTYAVAHLVDHEIPLGSLGEESEFVVRLVVVFGLLSIAARSR